MTDAEMLPLEREQLAETARLLATALHDDPAYAVLYPDVATRRARLTRFFEAISATTFRTAAASCALRRTERCRRP